MKAKKRCTWAGDDKLMQAYHDEEWGRPLHNDQKLFEFLILEGAQAGLSWSTVLQKRKHYRKVFDNFNPKIISMYSSAKVSELLKDPGIIRNKLKVDSAIRNAKVFLEIQKEYGSFDTYIWQFVGGKPIINRRKSIEEIPATTPESDSMSKDLKKKGMNFVGSTICYAFMQATGMVNDHETGCFCFKN